jgi:hypothetical protein
LLAATVSHNDTFIITEDVFDLAWTSNDESLPDLGYLVDGFSLVKLFESFGKFLEIEICP